MHESEDARAPGHCGSVGSLNPKAPTGLCLQLGRQQHAFISSQECQQEGGTQCGLCWACHPTLASVLFISATASIQLPVLKSTGHLPPALSSVFLAPAFCPVDMGASVSSHPSEPAGPLGKPAGESLTVELEVVWVHVARHLNPWVKVYFAEPFGKWPQVARAGTAPNSDESDGGRGRAVGWD